MNKKREEIKINNNKITDENNRNLIRHGDELGGLFSIL